MITVGVIPARYESTRLPGKPLKDILGYPMIWWVYERVKTIRELEKVVVATDDERILSACQSFGIPVVMTSNKHRTGANRVQEVSELIGADFYIQINGDEPLIDTDAIVSAIPDYVPQDIEFGTNIITEIREPAQVIDISNIKVVFDEHMNAMYMSRAPIPYPYGTLEHAYYKHVGIIGYNKKMLDFYKTSSPGQFELIEGIDTLRFLDYAKQLKLIKVKEFESLSVDTEKDLELVTCILRNRQNGKK